MLKNKEQPTLENNSKNYNTYNGKLTSLTKKGCEGHIFDRNQNSILKEYLTNVYIYTKPTCI